MIDPTYPTLGENFVIKEPFYVAITHCKFEETIEIPYIVGFVEYSKWKKA